MNTTDVVQAFKEWGGWVAGPLIALFAYRDKRINELIVLKVRPDELHETLDEIKSAVKVLDGKVDENSVRLARLEERVQGRPQGPAPPRLVVKKNQAVDQTS